MRCRDNPSFVYQSSTAGNLLVKVLSLDHCRLPGHLTIFGVLAADNLRRPHVGSAAFWFGGGSGSESVCASIQTSLAGCPRMGPTDSSRDTYLHRPPRRHDSGGRCAAHSSSIGSHHCRDLGLFGGVLGARWWIELLVNWRASHGGVGECMLFMCIYKLSRRQLQITGS